MGFAALIMAGANRGIRGFLVLAATALTMAAGVALAYRGPTTIQLPPLFGTLAQGIEPLIILIVIALGFLTRSRMVRLMGAAQLALAIAGTAAAQGGEPHPLTLTVDWLSIVMVLVVSVIGGLIAVYAIGYMNNHERHAPKTAASTNRFFFFIVAFLGLMNGLVLVDDLKWLSIFWEGTTLCSFFLIGHDGTDEARVCARRALLINTFGGLAMSLAGSVAYAWGGTESIAHMMAGGAVLPLALLSLATMTKSAQLPFQSWLLGAMVAPTPVSALLHSSTMVKAGSYLILRLAPALGASPLAPVVAVAGAFTFVATSALAIGQSNGKKVLAYSTIANLGLIATCAALHSPLAYAAALTLLVFHAISKALLFLCVGTIEQTIGSRHIEDMSGILYKMPVTTIIAIVGMASMIVPPFGMLIGKWMAIESSVHTPLVMLLLIAGSALTIFIWAKWLGRITTASYHPVYQAEKVSPWMMSVLGLLGLGVLTASVAALPIYRAVVVPFSVSAFGRVSGGAAVPLLDAAETFMAWPMLVLLGAVILAGLTAAFFVRSNHVRLPFLCGENVEDGELSYRFRGPMDGLDTAMLTSYYPPIFAERRITLWANPIAILVILTLFGVIVP